ncbi:MAG: DUF4442 domain-containing protein [Pseudomonadota bacterium]
MDPFTVVNHIRRHSPLVANRLLDRLIVPRIIPLARGLKLKVEESTDLRCVLSMPVSKRSRNHLGTMYFGAQMTLIDLTVGVLLFQRFPMGPFGGVIKRVETNFLIKAKGTIHCTCELDVATIDHLEAVRTSESGKVEGWVPFKLVDEKQQVVTDGRVQVAIKRF